MTEARVEIETETTEITIAPDGRVFVFGLSAPVLEILSTLNPYDGQLERRLERLQQLRQSEVGVNSDQGDTP